ncbi:amidohydrolase family protein (plasmid) [Agrobacterium tumefaciens]|uniref:metal-dependent hydrolase family protein n=1 Tax=Agrobacterium tumefaciens TaxID=358 RepID=UPI001572BF6B|nr:amidohydrolase family protein [Agrobacterium tumefaciens]NSY46588.1 amidohydrolase family protein [Agrobacterium tumefaciens]NSZ87551.1 amidohydrolase family protein [Agrobacterium tumefaciens]WCA72558.1 amidohydrolase family protein [Agrobacterium tumefaciens]
MTAIIFENARIVDGTVDRPSEPVQVLVEGGSIREVEKNIASASAQRIDLSGKTLMPGLIDAHVHVVASTADLGQNGMLPDALVTVRAFKIMGEMLARGFTTVRDVGGATSGLVAATLEAAWPTPRLNISGKALAQTGGHCDYRGPYNDDQTRTRGFALGALGRICDGVPDVRKAAREELKSGANFIKIMANGGVSSPTDPIHFLGFSREEILAVVEEAENAGTYVSAHLYTDQAIRRAVECGVHSLEHCNLIGSETAKFAAEKGAFAVPTLVTYDKLSSEGAAMGLPAASIAKVDDVRLAGMESLTIMREAGLQMAYGSDLLGGMHVYQSEEFVIRGRVLPAVEVIASATHIAARLLRMEGRIGAVSPGAYADLIVVDGNPLEDLTLLTHQGAYMPMIMKAGVFIKR